jgi:hypothetical protein
VTRYDWEWPKDGKKGGEKVESFYCFRTGPEPADLTPYVAWTNPAPNARNMFYGEDLFVLFNTAGMNVVYGDRKPLLVLYDQHGNEIGKGGTGKDRLDKEEQILMLLNQKLVKKVKPTLKDKAYSPRRQYLMKILHPVSRTPVFTLKFTTSQFKSFADLMDDKRTLIGGTGITAKAKGRQLKPDPTLKKKIGKDCIVISTPEPLPWKTGRLGVTLKNKSKTGSPLVKLKRVSPDYDTTHIFVPLDGNKLDKADYDLNFDYARKLPGLNPGDLREKVPSLIFYKDIELANYLAKETRVLSFSKI